ncbi:hypothetical protein HMPREF0044_0788 [Gleimia coleocanis DSM 15436]|uniref:Peptidoglycan binding domain protein n=1 Tax=Gleimia coleocanis DSM 15436 TaxID=525245 RepID=C0VZR0_9ACTO|nr:hypothetical protein [Gleimia coleocanis]EEH63769.1 hypothetical protein HMPREF0044_0788 [Gleimia coleocanis DSM 15436]
MLAKLGLVTKIIASVLAIAVTFALGFWAAKQTQLVNEADTSSTEATTVEAKSGMLQREYTFGMTIETPLTSVGSNLTPGIVTEVGDTQVKPGSVVYRVNNQPVYGVQSEVPFWRELLPGISGMDVTAFQKMLKATGYYKAEPTGRFDNQTLFAWRVLQKANQGENLESVPLGMLVAFPVLPTTVEHTDSLSKGKQLAGGEDLLRVPAGNRQYYLSLAKEQLEFAPIGANVTVSVNGNVLSGVVTQNEPDTNATTTKILVAQANGKELCDPKCHQLPVVSKQNYLAKVSPSAPVEGIIIPLATIRTNAQNETYVIDNNQQKHPVEILGTNQGLAAVKGIPVGTVLKLTLEKGNENGVGSK